MNTLVIHPHDRTTEFLSEIYSNKDWTIITKEIPNKEMISLIKSHDRVIMLGRGTPSGMFGFDKVTVGPELVPSLKEKICIGIWSYADNFFKKYGLIGYACGKIVSDNDDAEYHNLIYTTDKVNQSNKILAKSIKLSIDSENIKESIMGIMSKYTGNDVIKYNINNI